MCLAIPGKVISIQGDTADVDVDGVITQARIDLLEDVNKGDYVLVHTGFAIQKYDRADAEETLKLFEEIKRIAEFQ